MLLSFVIKLFFVYVFVVPIILIGIFALFIIFLIGRKIALYYQRSIFIELPKVRRYFYKSAAYTLILPFFLVVVLHILLIPVAYQDARVCVKLPNGLLIGWHSYIDTKEIITPINGRMWTHVALKLPDGTILISGNRTFHFTKSTVYGNVDPLVRQPSRHKFGLKNTKSGYYYQKFAYRNDVGLVFAKENRKLYEKLIKEAGQPIQAPLWLTYGDDSKGYSGKYVSTNLAGAFFAMRKDPTYRRESCPLDIFP